MITSVPRSALSFAAREPVGSCGVYSAASIKMVRRLRQYLRDQEPMWAITFMDLPDEIERLAHTVLIKGEDMRSMPLTQVERQVFQAAIPYCDVDPFRPMECFRNAQELARGDLSGQFVYYEGVATSGRWAAVHHAWVCINGKVIDSTWKRGRGDAGQPVFGEIPEGWAYRGLPFPIEIVRDALDDYEEGIPLLRSYIRPVPHEGLE